MYADNLQKIYLDRVNNFLTDSTFASTYGLTEQEARELIVLAEKVHERLVKEYKEAIPKLEKGTRVIWDGTTEAWQIYKGQFATVEEQNGETVVIRFDGQTDSKCAYRKSLKLAPSGFGGAYTLGDLVKMHIEGQEKKE